MKKPILLSFLTFFTLFTVVAEAQRFKKSATFFELRGGYEFGAQTSNALWVTEVEREGAQSIYRTFDHSLGEGTRLAMRFGHMFSRHLGLDVGVEYLHGTQHTTESNFISQNFVSKTSHSFSSTQWAISPSLLFSTGGKTWSPYVRIGLMAASNEVEQNRVEVYQFQQNTNKNELDWKYHRGYSWGWQSGLGMEYRFNKHVALMGEVRHVAMNFSPNRRTLTSFKQNGEQVIQDINKWGRIVDYTDEIHEDINEPSDPNRPNQHLRIHLPFNSIGVTLGVRFQW